MRKSRADGNGARLGMDRSGGGPDASWRRSLAPIWTNLTWTDTFALRSDVVIEISQKMLTEEVCGGRGGPAERQAFVMHADRFSNSIPSFFCVSLFLYETIFFEKTLND